MMKTYSSFLLVTFMLTTAGFAEEVPDEFFEIKEQGDGKMILRAHATDENIEDVIRRFEEELESRLLKHVGEGETCQAKPPTETETTTATTTAEETATTTSKVIHPPSNLEVPVNGTSLTPSWSSSTGVTSYEIEIKIGSTSILKISSATNGKEITNDAIKPATMYNISVVAVIGDQRSDATTKPFNTTFDAPNVIIDEVLQNTFRLSWSEVNGTSSYEYKCTPRDSNYTSTSNKSVKIDKLTANTEYTCSVRGTNDGSIKGNSGFETQTTCPTYDKTTDCNAAYNGTCFQFVANGTSIALATASQFCEDGFQLGKITDDCMFNALKKYHENKKFGGRSGEQYWTGSQITPQDVDDYHMETGYIYNNWRSDAGLDPKVGQYITIKAQNFLETKFEILGASPIKTGGEENKIDGAFCVEV